MREIALNSLYQHLLLNKDIRKCVFECMDGANEIDGYLYSITIGTVEREYNYIQKLSQYLRDDWEFYEILIVIAACALLILAFSVFIVEMNDIYLAKYFPEKLVLRELKTLLNNY